MLKLQYFGHLMQRGDSLEKDPDARKDKGKEKNKAMEGEMVWWNHWLNGYEFKQTPGDSEVQGSLACFNSLGSKDSDMSEWLNNSNKVRYKVDQISWRHWDGAEFLYFSLNTL